MHCVKEEDEHANIILLMHIKLIFVKNICIIITFIIIKHLIITVKFLIAKTVKLVH